jgi:hypothetical protein
MTRHPMAIRSLLANAMPPRAFVVHTRASVTAGALLALGVVILGAGGCAAHHRQYLIPKGYVGWVRVDFEIPGAPPIPLEDGSYVFKIPPSGRMQTSTRLEGTWTEDYYLVSGGSRQPLEDGNEVLRRSGRNLRGDALTASPFIWDNGQDHWGRGDDREGDRWGAFVGTQEQYQDFGSVYGEGHPVRTVNPNWGRGGKRLIKARLRGAQLRKANLKGANLLWANLTGARLQGADLRDAIASANLTRADLRQANLSQADLIAATMTGANLGAANLQTADLFNADLRDADMTDANLEGAKLEGAKLTGAKLIRVNLHGALYDVATRWPAGFKPIKAGAILTPAQPGPEAAD